MHVYHLSVKQLRSRSAQSVSKRFAKVDDTTRQNVKTNPAEKSSCCDTNETALTDLCYYLKDDILCDACEMTK